MEVNITDEVIDGMINLDYDPRAKYIQDQYQRYRARRDLGIFIIVMLLYFLSIIIILMR